MSEPLLKEGQGKRKKKRLKRKIYKEGERNVVLFIVGIIGFDTGYKSHDGEILFTREILKAEELKKRKAM